MQVLKIRSREALVDAVQSGQVNAVTRNTVVHAPSRHESDGGTLRSQ
jgi:hypothetical protein